MHQNIYIKLNNDHSKKFSKTTITEMQSQYWGGYRKLSMEGIDVEYFPSLIHTGRNEKYLNFIDI